MITFSIEDFFSMKFEIESTNLLLNNKLYFSEDAVEDYIIQIQQYPLNEYIQYLIDHPINDEITSKDITQLSSIDDCTINMCKIVKAAGNPGMSLTELATALHADENYKDNAVALTKYGENQVKTAAQLKLAVYQNDLWYLTAVGYVFCNLEDKVQKKFLAITLLRDPFYSKIILSLIKQDTNLRDFMSILSESTQIRRCSSCMRVLTYFVNQCSKEGILLHNLMK